MAINDPYDRSGQYAGGDRGPNLDNYGGLASDNPDRRDVAIGTMMGEGGPRENAAGYGAILDSIENRIGAIQGGANYGTKRGDSTLEGVVKARNGAEYNAWSEKYGGPAYGQALRGQSGKPAAGKESQMYDQARQVYDDYYDTDVYNGIAQGGTFYQQNAHVKGKAAGAYQRNLQSKFGAVPVGIAGHVMTGPGLYGPGSKTGRGAPGGYSPVSSAITGSFAAQGTPEINGFAAPDFINAKNRDVIANPPMPPARPAPQMQQIKGGAGVNSLRGQAMGDPVLGKLGVDEVFQPATRRNTPQRAAAAPAPQGPAMPSRQDYWTPGPVATRTGSGATGLETRRTEDGVIHDNRGAYGGKDAFGPNDPFGGLGYETKGYADVIDQFDRALGGITRSVYDKQGNLTGRMNASIGTTGAQGEPTGHDNSGNATVGDGSFAEQAGYNDNNPQGIV